MAESCEINFGVTFPLNELVNVNGKNAEPVFQWLKQEKGGLLNNDIKWNFTKFLIDREGNVIERFAPKTEPKEMEEEIQKLL